jgi:hypothetical protein
MDEHAGRWWQVCKWVNEGGRSEESTPSRTVGAKEVVHAYAIWIVPRWLDADGRERREDWMVEVESQDEGCRAHAEDRCPYIRTAWEETVRVAIRRVKDESPVGSREDLRRVAVVSKRRHGGKWETSGDGLTERSERDPILR